MKNVSLGIFDPSLGIFDPARCRRNPDFWVVFRPKTRSVLRNRQAIPRLSRVSSRAREGKTRGWEKTAKSSPAVPRVRSSVAFVRRPSYRATARAGPASETLPETGPSLSRHGRGRFGMLTPCPPQIGITLVARATRRVELLISMRHPILRDY